MTLKYIWRSFSLGCHFHVHFSYPWHAFALHGLPAIAELLVMYSERKKNFHLSLTAVAWISVYWKFLTYKSYIHHKICNDNIAVALLGLLVTWLVQQCVCLLFNQLGTSNYFNLYINLSKGTSRWQPWAKQRFKLSPIRMFLRSDSSIPLFWLSDSSKFLHNGIAKYFSRRGSPRWKYKNGSYLQKFLVHSVAVRGPISRMSLMLQHQ